MLRYKGSEFRMLGGMIEVLEVLVSTILKTLVYIVYYLWVVFG